MTREEAIDKATEIVEAMGNTPSQNNRGYKIDGWRPPTIEERTDAILKLAGFLIGPPERVVAPTMHHPDEWGGI